MFTISENHAMIARSGERFSRIILAKSARAKMLRNEISGNPENKRIGETTDSAPSIISMT
jgi:hypothetical protein